MEYEGQADGISAGTAFIMKKEEREAMSRDCKKIISGLLAMLLVISTMPGFFVSVTVAKAEETVSANAAASTELLPTGVGVAMMEGEEITVSFAKTSCVYIPITLDNAGYLNVYRSDKSAEDADILDDITVSVISGNTFGSASGEAVLVEEKVSEMDETGAFYMSAGAYYIKVTGVLGTESLLRAAYSTGLVIDIGKTSKVALGNHKASKKFYMQFTASKTGYLGIENMTGSKVSVGLATETKKSLSKKKSLSAYSSKNHKDGKTQTGYGVIKGKTYLLYVQAAASVKKASLKTSIKSYNSVGGKSFARAKTLSKGKAVAATMGAGEAASYFKFKKSSYGRKYLTMDTSKLKNQGSINMKLYFKEVSGPKKGKILPVKVNGRQVGYTIKGEYKKRLNIPANWPNVTYYVKVSRTGASDSGSYKVTIK